MPIVPEYNPNRVAARPVAGQKLQAPQLDTTSVPNAIGRVASLAQSIMVKEIDRENETRVKEADITYQTKVRDLLEDAENGFYTRKGGAAVDEAGSVTENLKRIHNEALDATKNPVQRQMLEDVLNRRSLQNKTNISRHTVAEKRKWEKATAEARAANTISDAVSNRYDDAAVQLAINTGLDEMAQLSAMNGEPPEEEQRKKEIYTTELHKAVINSHLENRDVESARAHFDKFKTSVKGQRKNIIPEEVGNINKTIKAYERRAMSQGQTDKIVATISDNAKQLEAARKIKDPEVRDEVVTRVKARQAEQKNLKADQDRKRADATWKRLFQVPSFDNIPPGMDPASEARMRTYVTNRANGNEIVNNKLLDMELTLEAANDPVTFAKRDLYKHVNDLSSGNFEQQVARQASIIGAIRQGKSLTGSDDLYSLRTDLQASNDVLKRLDINPNAKPGTADFEKTADFYNDFTNEVRRFQLENGKEPDSLEKDNIRAKLVFNVVEEGFTRFSDDDIPAFQVSEETGIPQGRVLEFIDIMRAADPNAKITTRDIKSLYDAFLKKQTERLLNQNNNTATGEVSDGFTGQVPTL